MLGIKSTHYFEIMVTQLARVIREKIDCIKFILCSFFNYSGLTWLRRISDSYSIRFSIGVMGINSLSVSMSKISCNTHIAL